VPVGQGLAISARDGLNAMRNLSVFIQPTQFPCTLPIGSGNEYDDSYRFYPCVEDELLTETGGSILLEDIN